MRIVLTTTWNSVDLIAIFLSHYQMLGFDQVMVMDFDSTDGTREVLADPRWQGFVSLFPFPGLSELDSSNLMLAAAKADLPQHSLGLFCDPDELLVLPSMNAREDIPLGLGGDDLSGWILPRSNMTSARSVAMARQDAMNALGTLRYRAGGATRTDHVKLIGHDRLHPPWIFTQLPGKALVRLSETTAIDGGDHTATGRSVLCKAPEGAYILHYPFRSLEAFEKKIAMAKQDFATNTHLPPTYGWQLRRWIKLAERGDLPREYLEQFPEDADLERYLAEGALKEDLAIIRFHSPHSVPG